MIGFVKSLKYDGRNVGIHVNAMMPGGATGMTNPNDSEKRMAPPVLAVLANIQHR